MRGASVAREEAPCVRRRPRPCTRALVCAGDPAPRPLPVLGVKAPAHPQNPHSPVPRPRDPRGPALLLGARSCGSEPTSIPNHPGFIRQP